MVSLSTCTSSGVYGFVFVGYLIDMLVSVLGYIRVLVLGRAVPSNDDALQEMELLGQFVNSLCICNCRTYQGVWFVPIMISYTGENALNLYNCQQGPDV